MREVESQFRDVRSARCIHTRVSLSRPVPSGPSPSQSRPMLNTTQMRPHQAILNLSGHEQRTSFAYVIIKQYWHGQLGHVLTVRDITELLKSSISRKKWFLLDVHYTHES